MTDWQVSGFTEIRELGRGGQGRVVLARHAKAGTFVAIKYLTSEAAPESRERLRRESQMLGRVKHPHVARLYRLVENADGMAIVMEAVNGVPLTEILAHHRTLEPEAALAVLKGSLLGLAAAHDAGVVHRDYKPANVIVQADGISKLIDFGVAVWSGEGSGAGTPHYMAPEQWRGEPASPATDVYAATCVFFECVTGRRPFGPGDRATLRAAHLGSPAPTGDVPEQLRELVARGMAKDPADRPGSADAFVAHLEEVASKAYGPAWESRGVRALAGGVVAVAALLPLTAAGLTAAGGTAGTGLLAALGTKTGVAVAGTAVATAAVGGGVGVYQALDPDPVERPAGTATTASPSASPSGKRLDLGGFTITVPTSWRLTRTRSPLERYEIRLPGRCLPTLYTGDLCPNIKVLDRRWIDPPEDAEIQGYEPGYAWHPGTDPSHDCPPRPKLPMALGDRLLKRGFAKVGGRTAEYREWRMRCGDVPTGTSNVHFVQRLWYLPTSRILIVDEWNTPGLAQILARAQWS